MHVLEYHVDIGTCAYVTAMPSQQSSWGKQQNRCILKLIWIRYVFALPLLLNFVFTSSFLKTLPFPTYTQTCLSKITIAVSLTIWSSWNFRPEFAINFRTLPLLEFVKQCMWWEKSPSHHSFLFPAYTQTCSSKTMISNYLTVGLSWNLNTRFEIHFLSCQPFGFAK